MPKEMAVLVCILFIEKQSGNPGITNLLVPTNLQLMKSHCRDVIEIGLMMKLPYFGSAEERTNKYACFS